MACEKYSGWMIETALDALAPERQAEFSAHVSECRACREKFERLRAVSVVIDRSIGSLVASEPSPHFEARLRARLSAEPTAQRAWRLGWAPIGALAAVLIAAVVLLAVRSSQTRRNSFSTPSANSVANVDASKTQSAGEIVSDSGPHPTARISKPEPLGAALHEEQARLSPSRDQQPEVLVPPGQFAMIERYAQAAREGRVDGGQIVRLGDDAAPLEVKAIAIVPLKIQALPGPNDSDSSDPSDAPDSGKS